MIDRRIVIVAALVMGIGCGGAAPPASQAAASPQPTAAAQQTPPSTSGAAAQVPRKNACALFDRADIEAIAGGPLETLHDIEEENKTTCEVRQPGKSQVIVYVTVHWTGGKELARINQAGMSMAKQKLNDEDVDIEAITGSEKVRGLADKAYYSDLMPSWLLKNDVMIEILSPGYDHEKTQAVFIAVAKKALTRL
jgi:hypothetical protein